MSDPSPFTVLLRVRYAECDAQHVVFNARYADYVDIVMTEFMREAFGGFQQLLERGLDNQAVHLAIDWQASAQFDDVLALQLQPRHVGNTSFSFTISIDHHANKQPLAKAEIVYVMVDTTNYNKLPIPDDMRETFAQGLPGVVINLAGNVAET